MASSPEGGAPTRRAAEPRRPHLRQLQSRRKVRTPQQVACQSFEVLFSSCLAKDVFLQHQRKCKNQRHVGSVSIVLPQIIANSMRRLRFSQPEAVEHLLIL